MNVLWLGELAQDGLHNLLRHKLRTVLTLLEGPLGCANKGDGDGDCHIDADDHAESVTLWSGPETPADPAAECYDFDDDTDVDVCDWAALQAAGTGPGGTIPGCTP